MKLFPGLQQALQSPGDQTTPAVQGLLPNISKIPESELGQTVTFPGGATVNNSQVRLPNGLTGIKSEVTIPGVSESVEIAPELSYSSEQLAGLFSTDDFYTAEQRANDLALLNGPRTMGPHRPGTVAADAAARAAATDRLNAHWNQKALQGGADGTTVVPGLGYSPTQLANDLSLAGTTGNLDEASEQLRQEARDRLNAHAYTRQSQDEDQLSAHNQYLPFDDPRRIAEVQRYIDSGLTPGQAQNAVWRNAVEARNRLNQVGIPLLDRVQVEQLDSTPRLYSTDPRRPFTPDNSPYEGKPHDFTEVDFRNLVGDLTGLNDLSEGLEDGDYGQAAIGGLWTVLTFTPGAFIKPGMAGLRSLGRWADGAPPTVGPGSAGLGYGIRAGYGAKEAGEGASVLYQPWDARPGVSPYVPEGGASGVPRQLPGQALIPDNPSGAYLPRERPLGDSGELPWNTGPATPSPAVQGLGSRLPRSFDPDPAGLGGPTLYDPRFSPINPSIRPRDIIPRRGPGEHGAGTPSNTRLGSDPQHSGSNAPEPAANSHPSPQAASREKYEQIWRPVAEEKLRSAGIDPGEVFGDLPVFDHGRVRLAKSLATNPFGTKAIEAGMEPRALRFALEQEGRGNPYNFTNAYEYYKARFDDAVLEVEPGIPKRQKPLVAAQTFNDTAIAKDLARDLELISTSNRGAVAIDPLLDGRGIDGALRSAENLGFGNPYSAAYHPYKHKREIPDLDESSPTLVLDYQNSAAKTVREGRLVEVRPLEGGTMQYVYHRDINDLTGKATTVEVLVNVKSNGTAVLASYAKRKVDPPAGGFWEWPESGPPSKFDTGLEKSSDYKTHNASSSFLGATSIAGVSSLISGSDLRALDGAHYPDWSSGMVNMLRQGLKRSSHAQNVAVFRAAAHLGAAGISRVDRSLMVNIVPAQSAANVSVKREEAAVVGLGAHIG
ncbi:hypothetical protein [Nocardia fluminea]|nr:hypothetical protein [Nocardia fluminea]